MESNHFEKQVREKLAELKIQPSEKTWTGIESRIGKKDSRKKILWMFFIGIFLLTGGIVLFQMNEGRKVKMISHIPETNIKSNSKTGIKSVSSDSVSRPDTVIGKKQSNSYFQNYPGSTGQKIISLKSADEIKPRFEKEITKRKLQEVKPGNTVSRNIDVRSNKPMDQSQENKSAADLSKEFNPENTRTSLNSSENQTGQDVAKFDSFVEAKVSNEEMALMHSLIDKEKHDESDPSVIKDLSKKSDVAKKITPFSSSAKKWELGFSLAAGKFYLGDGINLGLGLEKNFASSDLSYSNPGPSSGIGYYQPFTGPSSAVKNSIEFKAGVILRKPVFRKSSFSTGLGYAYYTNTILIGNQLPSGNYSSVGMLTSYRNNIHFIELPLSMRFQLNNQAKIPLHLTVGMTISQLISSDAMQYKSGIYSVDNSYFQKTQIGFDAGFSATFFNKLSAGPYYNYGINQFGKEGMYGKKHLNSYGLKAEYIFRKNK